jgi:hypothetical protein
VSRSDAHLTRNPEVPTRLDNLLAVLIVGRRAHENDDLEGEDFAMRGILLTNMKTQVVNTFSSFLL